MCETKAISYLAEELPSRYLPYRRLMNCEWVYISSEMLSAYVHNRRNMSISQHQYNLFKQLEQQKKRKTAEQLTGIGEIKIKQVLKKKCFFFKKNDTLEMLQQMQAIQYKALKFLEHHVCSLITSHLTDKKVANDIIRICHD